MKKGLLGLGFAVLVIIVALVGCQTAKPTTPQNSIQTEQAGLAPDGDKQHSTIDFSLAFGNKDAIKGWKVEMVNASGPQKQWSGDAKSLPSNLTWDGRSEAGSMAPEGTYTAKLTVDYGTATPAGTAESNKFVLDVSPPTGSLSFNPQQVNPDKDGAVDAVTIAISGKSAVAKMDSWSLDILDPDGKTFRSFDGKWPGGDIRWDGRSTKGDWVAPAQTYSGQATLRDEFGLTTKVTATIDIGGVPVGKAAPGSLAVIPGSAGFSPNGDKVMDTMKLNLSYGPKEAVSSVNSWKLEILDSSQKAEKTFTGDGSNLPMSVTWDGKNDSGALQPDGKYTARLSVDYGSAFNPGSTTSTAFVLDVTPPTGSLMLSDPLFSPIEGKPTITISVDASSPLAKIDSWRLEISDPENHLFRAFELAWPSRNATWDGKSLKGDFVESAEDYPAVAKVKDEFGNVGTLKTVIPVDILVEKVPTGFRILSSRIFFKAYTADYQNVRPDLATQNAKRLNDLASKLKKFPNYKIKLVGHAVMIHWDNKALGDIEQQQVLIPLSKARAEAVMKALVDRGLASGMFTTEGVGASDQLVPDSNLNDRWQNRRVAFFLEK